jgi:hypothetical protein
MSTHAYRALIVDLLETDPWPAAAAEQAAALAPDSPVYAEMEAMADGLVLAVAHAWDEEDPATVAEEVVEHFGAFMVPGEGGEPEPEFLLTRTALACLVSLGHVSEQFANIAATFGRPTLARAAAEALRFLAVQAAAQTDQEPGQVFAGLRAGAYSRDES